MAIGFIIAGIAKTPESAGPMLWTDTILLAGWMIAAFLVASFTFKWE
jgi:hypothetical protein